MTKLRTWRTARKISLADLAKTIKISTASLSRIERGEQWPDKGAMERIFIATKGEVTPNDFLDIME